MKSFVKSFRLTAISVLAQLQSLDTGDSEPVELGEVSRFAFGGDGAFFAAYGYPASRQNDNGEDGDSDDDEGDDSEVDSEDSGDDDSDEGDDSDE